jgi:hypothetical protein
MEDGFVAAPGQVWWTRQEPKYGLGPFGENIPLDRKSFAIAKVRGKRCLWCNVIILETE